jgi:TrwC relaxase
MLHQMQSLGRALHHVGQVPNVRLERDGAAVTVTMHKLTAGDGYQYLIRQVAAVDSTSRGKALLIDYYSSDGESPGHWVGSGLASLESTGARWVPAGDVADVWAAQAGSQVSEAQMKELFGEGLHPTPMRSPPT